MLEPTSKPMSKIAYLYVGGTRTFADERVYASVQKHVTDVWGPGDNFFYLGVSKVSYKYQKWAGVPEDYTSPEPEDSRRDAQFMFEKLKPVAWAIHEDVERRYKETGSAGIEWFKRLPDETPCEWGSLNESYRGPQKLYYAYELMKAYEAKKGDMYEWVMFIRPDLTFLQDVPALDTMAKDGIYVQKWSPNMSTDETKKRWIRDHFAFAPRELAHAFFESALERYVCEYPWGTPNMYYPPRRNNEDTFADSFLINGVSPIRPVGYPQYASKTTYDYWLDTVLLRPWGVQCSDAKNRTLCEEVYGDFSY